MDNVPDNFGTWLGAAIDGRGLTVSEVARKAEIDQSNLSKIVAGKWIPRGSTRAKIARALGVPYARMEHEWRNFEENEIPAVRAGPADGPESQRFPQAPGNELVVEGDSMKPYINPGDRLILRAAEWGEQPSPGETVVVWIEGKGQAVYAWCAMPSGKVRLMKHNPAHARETIEVDPSEIQRLLRVERVVRRAT